MKLLEIIGHIGYYWKLLEHTIFDSLSMNPNEALEVGMTEVNWLLLVCAVRTLWLCFTADYLNYRTGRETLRNGIDYEYTYVCMYIYMCHHSFGFHYFHSHLLLVEVCRMIYS